MSVTRFAEATAVQQKDPYTYTAEFRDDWKIGSVPHGGIVCATFLQVVKAHFSGTLKGQNQPHTIALHLDYLRRTSVGPATFTVKNVKLGRQTSVVHVTLRQGDREEVVGYITQSNLSTEAGPAFDTQWQPLPPRQPVDLSKLESGQDPNWAEKTSWPNASFRKATTKLLSWFPRQGQPQYNIYDAWLRFRDDRDRWTNETLGYIVDSFPLVMERHLLGGIDPYSPSVDEKEMSELVKNKASMWYPTLLLNLDVKKALPEEGVKFLFSRMQVKQVKNGRYDVEVVIIDAEGDLVALSHHICFALDASRNTQERKKSDGLAKL